MDKTNAPAEYKNAADYYHPTNDPAAILLNFTLSSDNKTLYLNNQAILPLANNMVPPKLAAYQVPADISRGAFEDIKYWHLLEGAFFGMTIGYRYLNIDYDRLVWADPASGTYSNHVPTLKIRIMGLVAHDHDNILDDKLQKVVHVTLTDQKHGSSDAPDRSYLITDVALKESRTSYAYAGVLPNEASNIECMAKSWLCEDHDLYSQGAPWYRYIWRHNFDEFGRIGSLRREVMSRWNTVWRFLGYTWPIFLITFLAVFGAVALGYLVFGMVRYTRWLRLQRIHLLAEEDGLLGAAKDEDEEMNFGNAGFDEEPPSYEDSVKPLPQSPPPLPPRPASITAGTAEDSDLIILDVAATDGGRDA